MARRLPAPRASVGGPRAENALSDELLLQLARAGRRRCDFPVDEPQFAGAQPDHRQINSYGRSPQRTGAGVAHDVDTFQVTDGQRYHRQPVAGRRAPSARRRRTPVDHHHRERAMAARSAFTAPRRSGGVAAARYRCCPCTLYAGHSCGGHAADRPSNRSGAASTTRPVPVLMVPVPSPGSGSLQPASTTSTAAPCSSSPAGR